MNITKENLLCDKEGLMMQRQGLSNTIHYIDGLLAYLAREEVQPEAPCNPVIEPSENPDLGATS